ncbi:MAG: hypothetical protein R3B70_23280 [Polyangiaceae bacterium]
MEVNGEAMLRAAPSGFSGEIGGVSAGKGVQFTLEIGGERVVETPTVVAEGASVIGPAEGGAVGVARSHRVVRGGGAEEHPGFVIEPVSGTLVVRRGRGVSDGVGRGAGAGERGGDHGGAPIADGLAVDLVISFVTTTYGGRELSPMYEFDGCVTDVEVQLDKRTSFSGGPLSGGSIRGLEWAREVVRKLGGTSGKGAPRRQGGDGVRARSGSGHGSGVSAAGQTGTLARQGGGIRDMARTNRHSRSGTRGAAARSVALGIGAIAATMAWVPFRSGGDGGRGQ